MIKIPNFYASSPLRNEIGEKDKDSLRGVYPKMDKAIKEHNKLFRIMNAKIEGIGVKELNEVSETIKEKLP